MNGWKTSKAMPNDHISREEFLYEFFGNFGREFGNPDQYFTDNPVEILPFMEECRNQKKPAFISVNPRSSHDCVLGIEKLFFDFDYGKKSDKLSNEEIEKRSIECTEEVIIFLAQLSLQHITPMVIKTRKGYHVHIFFDRVYSLEIYNEDLYEETYRQLQYRFLHGNRHTYKYMDTSVIGDFKRLCRIPTSIHEKSGEECFLVKSVGKEKVERDKFRGIEYWKRGGLKEDAWILAVTFAIDKMKREKEELERLRSEKKEKWETEHGFVGKIRQCFQEAIDSGEMCHQQRLALLIEAYYAGYDSKETMFELFKKFHDFDEKTTKTQISWFWKNKVPDIIRYRKWKPYRCDTIEDLNWCLKSKCQIYKRRKGR